MCLTANGGMAIHIEVFPLIVDLNELEDKTYHDPALPKWVRVTEMIKNTCYNLCK